jgi:hypothetical protein
MIPEHKLKLGASAGTVKERGEGRQKRIGSRGLQKRCDGAHLQWRCFGRPLLFYVSLIGEAMVKRWGLDNASPALGRCCRCGRREGRDCAILDSPPGP